MSKYIDTERYINNLRELRTGDKDTVYEYYDDGIDVAISEAATFPAADIPRWIPVTERLPKEQRTYLVTVNDGGIRVAIAQWWYNYLDHAEGYFVCDDCYAEDIVAWMPLPTPYKGGEEE